MILQSKRSGNVIFRDDDGVKTLVAGETLVVKSEKVAATLMKMYPGVVIEVAREAEKEAPKTSKGKSKTSKGGNKGGSNENNSTAGTE